MGSHYSGPVPREKKRMLTGRQRLLGISRLLCFYGAGAMVPFLSISNIAPTFRQYMSAWNSNLQCIYYCGFTHLDRPDYKVVTFLHTEPSLTEQKCWIHLWPFPVTSRIIISWIDEVFRICLLMTVQDLFYFWQFLRAVSRKNNRLLIRYQHIVLNPNSNSPKPWWSRGVIFWDIYSCNGNNYIKRKFNRNTAKGKLSSTRSGRWLVAILEHVGRYIANYQVHCNCWIVKAFSWKVGGGSSWEGRWGGSQVMQRECQ